MALRDAVRDYDGCPALAKLHASLEDLLTLGLPKELRDWAWRLLVRGVPPALDAMMRTLVRHARRDDNEYLRDAAEVIEAADDRSDEVRKLLRARRRGRRHRARGEDAA